MPESKLAHGGARKNSGRKLKHADGSRQLSARISQVALNRLDALRQNTPKATRSDVLEQLIEAEYRRMFGEPPKMVNGMYVGTGG